MDIPKEIFTAIREGADNEYPIGFTTSGNGFGNVGFRIGAIFGYRLAQKELEEKDKENRITESQLIIAMEEIERLKGLLEKKVVENISDKASSCGMSRLQYDNEICLALEKFKKENNI